MSEPTAWAEPDADPAADLRAAINEMRSPRRTRTVEYLGEYDAGEGWRSWVRGWSLDAVKVAVTDLRAATDYPWRIVEVIRTEEVLDE